MSDNSTEDEDPFELSSVEISPKLMHPAVKQRRATTGCLDEGGRSIGHSDNDLSIPPSPLYYKKQSPCSTRNSPLRYDSKGSFASLQKYCSSLSIGSYLSQHSGQDNSRDFVIPSRSTPPRKSTLTATKELVYHIRNNGSKDYQALIKDKIDEDEPQIQSEMAPTFIDDEAEGFNLLENLLDFDDPFGVIQN